MFDNYIKVAIRNLWRYKSFSLINLGGLALGMACFILIMLWVQDELTYDQFHRQKDHLFIVMNQEEGEKGMEGGTTIPYALASIMTGEVPEIISFTRYQRRKWLETTMLRYGEKKFYEDNFFLADSSFFKLFTFKFIAGNPATTLSNPNSVVITEQIAQKYFGNSDPINKVLNYNNRNDLTVTGVIQKPENTIFDFEIIAPIYLLGEERLNSWSWESNSYVLLQKNADVDLVRTKIANMMKKYGREGEQKYKVNIQPVTKIHLYIEGNNAETVYIFSAIAIFILLIACFNFMNLATALSSTRAKEVGMRKVIGSTRYQLIFQFIGESLILAVAAAVIAVILVELFLPVFNNLSDKQLRLQFSLLMIVKVATIVFITGVLAGCYPAVSISSLQPINVLRKNMLFRLQTRKKISLRVILVISQFTISIALIIITTASHEQLRFIQQKEMGWNREHVVAFPINQQLRSNFKSIKNELQKNTDVMHVTQASTIPVHIGNFNPIDWQGKADDEMKMIQFVVTDHDYIQTFGMKIIEGRDFSELITTDVNNFIVNEEAVKFMNIEGPGSEWIDFMNTKGRIIGVVENFHFRHLSSEIKPIILTIHPQNYDYFLNYVAVKINSDNIPETLAYVKHIFARFAPDFPFDYQFVDQVFDQLYRTETRLKEIFNYFTLFAIFISCLGLFGLSSFLSGQRTKEVGIRKVLGASILQVIFLQTKEFTKWILIANLVAWPASYYALHLWFQNYAYHISLSFDLFIFAGGLAFMVALLTVSWQAVKAAIANPVESLRYE
jgi:putative ABC transport system permease protein